MARKRIYLGHSTGFDYREQYYDPLTLSPLGERYEMILPHGPGGAAFVTRKEFAANGRCRDHAIALFVAEVSLPSTGLGIELGYADIYGIKTICVHRSDAKPTSALNYLGFPVLPYRDAAELCEIVGRYLD